MVAHGFTPRTQETEVEEPLWGQGQSDLHSKFQVSFQPIKAEHDVGDAGEWFSRFLQNLTRISKFSSSNHIFSMFEGVIKETTFLLWLHVMKLCFWVIWAKNRERFLLVKPKATTIPGFQNGRRKFSMKNTDI